MHGAVCNVHAVDRPLPVSAVDKQADFLASGRLPDTVGRPCEIAYHVSGLTVPDDNTSAHAVRLTCKLACPWSPALRSVWGDHNYLCHACLTLVSKASTSEASSPMRSARSIRSSRALIISGLSRYSSTAEAASWLTGRPVT